MPANVNNLNCEDGEKNVVAIYRGYFTVARTYEVYLQIFFPREDKNLMTCSNQRIIFFLLHRYECSENKKTRQKTKEKQKNGVSDIFTSDDIENISLASWM